MRLETHLLSVLRNKRESISAWVNGKTAEFSGALNIGAPTGCTVAKLVYCLPDGASYYQETITALSNKQFLIRKKKLKEYEAKKISKLVNTTRKLPEEKQEYLREWITANT